MISAALLCQAAGLAALQPQQRQEVAPALLTADSQRVLGDLGSWGGERILLEPVLRAESLWSLEFFWLHSLLWVCGILVGKITEYPEVSHDIQPG